MIERLYLDPADYTLRDAKINEMIEAVNHLASVVERLTKVCASVVGAAEAVAESGRRKEP